MKKLHPKNPRTNAPRTSAQRRQMLTAAAQRRREDALKEELRRAKHQISRERDRADTMERDLARARIEGVSVPPNTSAYIDHVFKGMLREVSRNMAFMLENDPEVSAYLRNYIILAARMLADNPTVAFAMEDTAHNLLVEARDRVDSMGLEFQFSFPPMHISNVISYHEFARIR